MFPWDKSRDVKKVFRGNPYSKEGVAHRMQVARNKDDVESLGKYVRDSQLGTLHAEQDRRVQHLRKRNEALKRAGENMMKKREEEYKQRVLERERVRQDELLAKEMASRNQAAEARRREIQRICENDEGLRDLQLKLKMAYSSKERSLQIGEKKRLDSIKRSREREVDARLERERVDAVRENREAVARKKEISRQQARANNEQIHIKSMIEQEDAYNEFLRDKRSVEKLMSEIAEEIRQEELSRVRKKERLKQEMNDAIKERQMQLERRRQEEKDADIASAEYRQMQDLRKKKAEAKAAAAEARAQKIFNKLKADAEKKQAEEERVRQAIALLRKEEADRRRDDAERRKREKEEKSLREMMAANEAQKRHKVVMRAKQMEEEQKLVAGMLAKFKEDERKEKMEELARHQAKLQFKMNILDQLEEKRMKYEEMKAKDEQVRQQADDEEEYRRRIVEEARRRLIEQHAAALRGFLPSGVIQKRSDLRLLGAKEDSSMDLRGLTAVRNTMNEYGDLNQDVRSSEDRDRDAFQAFRVEPSSRRVDFSRSPEEKSEDRNVPQHLKSTRPW